MTHPGREGYEYLASPYSHSETKVRQDRYLEAMRATAYLLNEKRYVYSPIVHCHSLAQLHSMPTDFDFWQGYNEMMISQSKGLLVLDIIGVDQSRGVRMEKEYAKILGLPIVWMVPEIGGEYSFITGDKC